MAQYLCNKFLHSVVAAFRVVFWCVRLERNNFLSYTNKNVNVIITWIDIDVFISISIVGSLFSVWNNSISISLIQSVINCPENGYFDKLNQHLEKTKAHVFSSFIHTNKTHFLCAGTLNRQFREWNETLSG